MPRSSLLLSIVCLAILTILVYAPGLSGGFEFDDEANIVRNEQLQITELTPATLKQAAYSMQAGPLMRPISYLSLALNHYFTGLDPLYFKLTNLFIHLLNGLALYWLSRQLLIAYRRHHQPALTLRHIQWISLAVSAFWLLHPLGLTSVLYVVQRMNSLSALFVLLGLATYCRGRNRQVEGRSGVLPVVASVLVFTPLAVLSKENGALLPFFMLIVEVTLFRFAMPEQTGRRWLLAFFATIAVVPALVIIGYLLTHTDWLIGGYSGRDFTLSERLLTQARVIWFYLAMTVAPSISRLGLFHDDIPLSSGFLTPPTTGLAILGLAALLAGAWRCRRRAPLVSFGVLFFLVGHSMESSIFALEMVHEHRNYLPMYGILLPLVYYLLHPTLPTKTRKAGIVLSVVIIGVLGISTAIRASYWGDPLQLTLVEARNHPGSARSQYRLGQTYWQLMELQPEQAARYAALARERFEQARSLDPGNTSGLFALVMLDARLGLPLQTEQVAELTQRLQFRPFASVSLHHLRDLGQCLAKGLCQFAPQEINRVFAASLANPTLRGSTRAKVLSEAMVVALVQGDLRRALALGEEATRVDPKDPQHWLNYVSVLIQSGQLKHARNVLQELSNRNLQPFLQPRLAAQIKALQEAEQKPPQQ
ncbi:MAG: hypothetical protein BMS9Abin06_0192 [Gammaproteobacteria bacterium]|nr:MAG: hypothetical protein BMS9Abin06_0192 [Gammaproteobacteria bacterium]